MIKIFAVIALIALALPPAFLAQDVIVPRGYYTGKKEIQLTPKEQKSP